MLHNFNNNPVTPGVCQANPTDQKSLNHDVDLSLERGIFSTALEVADYVHNCGKVKAQSHYWTITCSTHQHMSSMQRLDWKNSCCNELLSGKSHWSHRWAGSSIVRATLCVSGPATTQPMPAHGRTSRRTSMRRNWASRTPSTFPRPWETWRRAASTSTRAQHGTSAFDKTLESRRTQRLSVALWALGWWPKVQSPQSPGAAPFYNTRWRAFFFQNCQPVVWWITF